MKECTIIFLHSPLLRRIRFITIVLFILLPEIVVAQATRWQIQFHTGIKPVLCTLDSLSSSDSILYITRKEKTFPISINSIAVVVRYGEQRLGEGAAIGALTGAVFGGFMGYSLYSAQPQEGLIHIDFGPGIHIRDGITVGGIAGLVVGTIIGVGVRNKEVYDLRQRNHTEKLQIVQWVVLMRK